MLLKHFIELFEVINATDYEFRFAASSCINRYVPILKHLIEDPLTIVNVVYFVEYY